MCHAALKSYNDLCESDPNLITYAPIWFVWSGRSIRVVTVVADAQFTDVVVFVNTGGPEEKKIKPILNTFSQLISSGLNEMTKVANLCTNKKQLFNCSDCISLQCIK